MRTDDPTPPSSSDTVIVVKKDLKRVQTPGEAKDEYVLPDWFLSRNVKGKAELDILQHVCRIAICGDEETMQEKDINNTDRKPAPGAENSKYRESTSPTESLSSDMAEDATKLDERNVIADFQISFNAFAELRDVTAAALVRNQLGKLPVSNPSILLRWSKTDETQYVESVLAHLAKDLQATLIAVDLEDLEDLGWEFDHQERGWTVNEIRDDPNNQTKLREEEEPDRNLAMGMTLHYLSARSKPHASEETWKRTMKAIGAILNAQSAKPQEQQSNSPETPVTNSGGSVDNDQPPLLLHVRDFSDMMRMSRGHRFLARLRDAVQEQRMFGRSVVLLVSLFRSSTCNKGGCQCNSCRKDDYRDQTRISKKISAGWASTVTITINSLSDKAEKIENERSDKRDNKKDNTNEVAQINIKRLKRFLRWRIPHLFLPEVLEALQPHQPFSSWQKHGFDAEYESMGVSQWSEEDLQRSVIQITGRAFGKSHLNLSDVRAVLSRLGLCEGFNKKPKGEKGEEKEGTRKEKLDKIRSDANEFETKLLSCIINPDDIRISYDDVIMDEETKDTVRHLVSLSGFKPQSASEFLLRHVRITGAMFYGPPGTGKTHLSRAIAKASGSNLLAIDSATIQSKWVGETEKYIKAAFTLSTKLYPCVLFIDEVDSLFYRRSSNDTSWQRSALAQFLSEMDGVSRSEKAPFVVVATNRPADLDEAFYRRLPQKIFFKLPDADSRARILNLFLMKEDLDENVDVAALARQTEGYSGSDLRNLCAEAALLWAIEQVRDIPLNKEEGEGAHGQIGMKKLKLELGHFTKALKKIRPSVSGQVIKELQEFAERFSLELPKPKPKPNPNGIVFHSMVNRSMKY